MSCRLPSLLDGFRFSLWMTTSSRSFIRFVLTRWFSPFDSSLFIYTTIIQPERSTFSCSLWVRFVFI